MTPPWKIRRKWVHTEDGMDYRWCVYKAGTVKAKARLRKWENALIYVELYESA